MLCAAATVHNTHRTLTSVTGPEAKSAAIALLLRSSARKEVFEGLSHLGPIRMSFAAASAKEDESKESSQQSSLVKSLRSVWKKAKQRPSLPGRWRRSVDLEKARQDHSEGQQSFQHLEESREDALFYSMSGGGDQQRSAASQELLEALRASNAEAGGPRLPLLANPRANYQVDYVNYLMPGLKDILNCPFYWGKMDRYEAEALLANKPEGSFLLRDSAQDDYVFSVSFRRYSRSLHARIEESKHQFSFDCHDPGVHTSKSIRGLLDHYKDPLSCMFFGK